MASYKGLKAILKKFSDLIEPVATIKEYAGTTTPEWHLCCLGQLLLISKYPKLYTELGGASSPWLRGDEPAGYFRAPDLRECVIVGVGKNTTLIFDNTELDPATGTQGTQDHDVYTLGEFKDDQMQNHTHLPNGLTGGRIHNGRDSGSNQCEDMITEHNTGLIASGRSGTTTHGKQVGLNYIIKY